MSESVMLMTSDEILYFQTSIEQTASLVKFFDGLKDLIPQLNISCSPSGLKILEMDDYDTLMIYALLDKLDVYRCTQDDYIFRLNIAHLVKFLKTIGAKKRLCFYILDSVEELLQIKVVDELDLKFTDDDDFTPPMRETDEFQLKLLMVEGVGDLKIPDQTYTWALNLETSDFTNICTGNKAAQTDKVVIEYQRGMFTFWATGDIGARKTTRQVKSRAGQVEEMKGSIDPYRGIFDLDRLNSFAKLMGSAGQLNLEFEKDFPLICTGELPFGDVTLMLSPISEEAC